MATDSQEGDDDLTKWAAARVAEVEKADEESRQARLAYATGNLDAYLDSRVAAIRDRLEEEYNGPRTTDPGTGGPIASGGDREPRGDGGGGTNGGG